MANPEDIVSYDLKKNDEGQYVNDKGEVVAVDSIAYRNERLEERKRDAIDDQLGRDKSTEVVDASAKRDNQGRQVGKEATARKVTAKKATEKFAKAAPKTEQQPRTVDAPVHTAGGSRNQSE